MVELTPSQRLQVAKKRASEDRKAAREAMDKAYNDAVSAAYVAYQAETAGQDQTQPDA